MTSHDYSIKISSKHETIPPGAEAWIDVPGWQGFYEVSSHGQIKSIRRHSRVNGQTPERKRWMGGNILNPSTSTGYKRVVFTADGRRGVYGVHRLVLLSFVGEPEDGQVTLHADGNPTNNNLCNLSWGTHKENMEDRSRHGKYASGENHCNAKLTDRDAFDIYHSKERGSVLAKKHGVSQTTISGIKRGTRRKESTIEADKS